MTKSFNTGFAVMVEGGRVCIFSLSQAKVKQSELKKKGYEVRVVPFVEEPTKK